MSLPLSLQPMIATAIWIACGLYIVNAVRSTLLMRRYRKRTGDDGPHFFTPPMMSTQELAKLRVIRRHALLLFLSILVGIGMLWLTAGYS